MFISIIVVFHNMRREAERTLYTLSAVYQNTPMDRYEVIAVDSNSSQPLKPDWVRGLQPNFRYLRVEVNNPSPCHAMNRGIAAAKGDKVMCLIDGARMLSPGILQKTLAAFRAYDSAYVHTLSFHLGHELQNKALLKGYNQQVEDQLLASVPWRQDGYQLFKIACLAASSARGYLYPINESNCFALDKDYLIKINGFDERFVSKGGGFVNLDLHSRLMQDKNIQPVLLLGEGSFHQFHGGVATNQADTQDLIAAFQQEYRNIRGHLFQDNQILPVYLGDIHPESRPFLAQIRH